MTDDNKFISLIDFKIYDNVYPCLTASIGQIDDKYYLNGSEITMDPKFST